MFVLVIGVFKLTRRKKKKVTEECSLHWGVMEGQTRDDEQGRYKRYRYPHRARQ